MKQTKLAVILLFLFLFSGCAAAQPKAPNLEFVRGDVLVVMDAPGGAPDVAGLAERVAGATGSKVIRTYEAIAEASGKCIFQLKSTEKTVDELLAEVRSQPGVKGATPNYIVKMLGAPDDPEHPSSWGMSHVKAEDAWETTTGSDGIYVAVLDTGINYEHGDLAANIGRDKDGNIGRNLINNGTNPMDDNGHGTLVAGIIGAVGDNGVGIAGVNWTVRLLGVKVLDGTGAGSYAHVIAGLDYVIGQKSKGLDIRVANMSFGAWTPTVDDPEADPLAVACGALSDAGVLLVAAAGNEGQNIDAAGGGYKGNRIYPASLSSAGLISAAAVAKDGSPAKFSNYGSVVDIAAPGFEILSTASDGGYKMISGTSAASAFVSGAATLLASSAPGMTAAQLKTRLVEFADRGQPLSGKVASGGALDIGAAIKNPRGSLRVVLEGPASARWSLDGKGSYESGRTLTGLPAGQHSVSFSDVDLWARPADSLVAVERDAKTTRDAKYIQQNASIWVTVEGPASARWTLDGKDAYEDGSTVAKVAGKRKVTFEEVPGWDAPAPQTVTVPKNAPQAVRGIYKRQTGSLTVTVKGPEEARWSLGGIGSYRSGETVENIPTGECRVSFSGVAEWDSPSDVSVQVEKGAVTAASGEYKRHTGAIRTTIVGPEDASWAINGRGLHASGETVEGIPTGVYTISFSAVRDWDSPSPAQTTVTRDAVAEIDREYQRHVGSLNVSIKGPDSARWSIEGADGQHASGETVEGLPVGEYTVVFSDVADWFTPERAQAVVARDSVASVEAAYTEHRGSISVEITEPAEATWALDGQGSYASGEVVKDVVVGTHTISYSSVADWDEPEQITVTVARDTLAKAEVAYKRHLGSVQVNIDGPVEARWTLDGETYHKGGEVVKDLVVGGYTVSFYDVLDWDEPADVAVTVTKDAVAKVDAVFTIHRGSVRIPFSGPDEGRWMLDGEGSHRKDETVDGVPVGTHRISFSQVEGWDAPHEFQVTVAKDYLAKAEPSYKRHMGSIKVTVEGPEGARWSIDGEGGYASGMSVGGIVTGEHTISFSEAAGWNAPLDHKLTVVKDATSELRGVYGCHTGTVAVYIDGPAEAEWRISGMEETYKSGGAAKSVPVGDHKVAFTNVDGWYTPEEQEITVFKDVTTMAAAEYRRHTGSASAVISGPDAAGWRLDGEGLFASGEVVQNVPIGEHAISFVDAEGWDTPAEVAIVVAGEELTSVTAEYTRHRGSLSVVIEGPETATWHLDGEGVYASGEVVQNLPTGEHAVSFADVDGWRAPEAMSATVTRDELVSLVAGYEQAAAVEEPAVEEEPATVEEEPAAEEEPAIVEEEPAAAEEESAIVEEEPATVEEEPATEEESAIVEEEPAIVEEEPAIVEEEPATEEESAIVEEEPATEEESAIVEEEPAIVEEEPVAVEEELAVVEEEPAATEEEPAIVEEEPAATEEEPAIVEEEPAATEEEPAIVEEEPATVEEEPVDEEESPASALTQPEKPVSGSISAPCD